MEKVIETGIQVNVNQKFGAALLDKAAETNKEKIQDRVVGVVAELLKQAEIQRKASAHLERMLSGIQKGEFTLSENGQIVFNDEDLNGDIRWISECAQCGYNKMVIAPARGAR